MMMSNRITADDLRRAARMVVAMHESDEVVLDLVASEVAAADRWPQHGLACAVVARVALSQIDEDEDGALALWLHSAVEAALSGADAWWRAADDE
jgi:hypothetical protein